MYRSQPLYHPQARHRSQRHDTAVSTVAQNRRLTLKTLLLSALLLISISLSLPAFALQSDWSETPQAKARLLIAAAEQNNGRTGLKAGLEIVLQPGWKTYWRTPGAAGIPPQVKAADLSQVRDVNLHYPAPQRLDFQGLQLYGYENRVIFPLDLTLSADASADIALSSRILICSELCIPVSFETRIPAKALPETLHTTSGILDDNAAFEINRFISRIPRPGSSLNLQPGQLLLDPEQKLLEVQLRLPQTMQLSDLFPELTPEPELDAPIIAAPENIENSSDQLWRAQFPIQRKRLPSAEEAAQLVLRSPQGDFELPLNWQSANANLTRLQGTPVTADNQKSPATGSGTSLWLMLLMALAGGLILNLMPCVLPVLSIKMLHLIKHSELKTAQIRTSFLATAAGIISSFMLLAAVLVALKASGQAIGWGIQFQQPLFIAALAIIVVIFAANLWGLFEFRLPGKVQNLGAEIPSGHSLSGSFAQGALATLLATPCSAPFLGTAIGFAFSQDNSTLLLIFLALGTGLALPYLLMTLRPQWVYKLPKPGRWMLTLKRVLSIGLLLTAGWLFWVLSDLVVLTGVAAVIALTACWWLLLRRHALFWLIPALALLLVAFLPAPSAPSTGTDSNNTEDSVHWVRFDPQAIAARVAEGKVVFVDITARWCVTCVANKVGVISTSEVQQALNAGNVIAMQGDWTRPDATISDFLNRHQRFGIPFNVVYGPGAPDGIILSEILTRQALLAALQQAQ